MDCVDCPTSSTPGEPMEAASADLSEGPILAYCCADIGGLGRRETVPHRRGASTSAVSRPRMLTVAEGSAAAGGGRRDQGSITGKHRSEVIVEGRRDIAQFVEQHYGILLAKAGTVDADHRGSAAQALRRLKRAQVRRGHIGHD